MTVPTYKLLEVRSFPFADLYLVEGQHTFVCISTKEYIPYADFQEMFREIGKEVIKRKITKFVFDKTSLRNFHQPSMEWYTVGWKSAMKDHGLSVYRKILPRLEWFEDAVRNGRAQIMRDYPDFDFSQFDIQYRHALEHAILH
ncbi:hypothetical protein [Algivirga pacifica]|uniref:STAS/SEC14 domain-containing protein n=1 Tax=Algivirga pacifica TaxID=1162670 RepID=A0ABP9D928_9BACT